VQRFEGVECGIGFAFPLPDKAACPLTVLFWAASVRAMRKKILLVDDNTELLELLKLNFKGAGFSIATATDGIDALKKTRNLKPDVILLDLMLPELDGFAVCETLKRDPETEKIPVLLFSGLNSQLARLAGLESGGTDFIAKPLSPQLLIQKIEKLLAGAAAA
jgi:two-component system alkaline phosphatase synthesis response regulator PhoP